MLLLVYYRVKAARYITGLNVGCQLLLTLFFAVEHSIPLLQKLRRWLDLCTVKKILHENGDRNTHTQDDKSQQLVQKLH
jgi:hypothetical protein